MKLFSFLAIALRVYAQGVETPVVNSILTASAFGAYLGAAAPASYIEIYGTKLAGSTREWAATDFSGRNAPTSLDGVTVSINGTLAYISYVSPGQINAQLPDAIAVGPASVVVTYQGRSSVAAMLTVNARQPGLLAPASFLVDGKQYVAAVHSATGTFVSNGNIPSLAAAPAVPGETLTVYATGFGPVTGTTVAGQIASGLSSTADQVSVTIGDLPATVTYSGLAPGLVGVYQLNIVVPGFTTAGDFGVQVALNGVRSSLQKLLLSVRPAANVVTFNLTSASGANGGALPNDYTCDGMGSTIQLSWSGAPSGTKEFAMLMTTLPGDGTTKWNWVLYGISGATTSLLRDSFLVGKMGVGSDGPGTVYNPPCSQGPGAKLYTYTVYALSASPVFSVPTNQVTGQMVTDAISGITTGKAVLNLSANRTAATSTGSSAACNTIRSSTRASKSGTAAVSCDATYAYVSSNGITTAPMMNGITSTNLQFPIPVNFNGSNAWKIPLSPAVAATPTSVVDGPLGVAINGLPIFNPCTQGGCVTGGDTKVLGQLDTCNGHAGRADDYHYHAAPNCMMADQPPSYWDTHPLGWALDGFAIFGFNDADGSVATRDAVCGGNTKTVPNAPVGYAYHVTNASPYVTNCLAGTPSPDLAGQGAKYRPFRQPPVTPFTVSGMTMTTDTDGYQVIQFTSAINFTATETGTDRYPNPPGTYKIRYKQVTDDELIPLLAQRPNTTSCWLFEFTNSGGTTTQPSVSYCK